MLKLSKYELRKNRNVLLILLGGLAALELVFLAALYAAPEYSYNVYANSDLPDSLFISILLLILYAVVCYFAVYIIAVANYFREINSKTSYLVFMTPVSCLKIVLSKMLTVFVIGVIFAAALAALGQLDCMLLAEKYEHFVTFLDGIVDLMKSSGFNAAEIGAWLLYSAVVMLLMVFSVVAVMYLCITLSATMFNSSGLRVFISIVLFIAVMIIRGKLEGVIGDNYDVDYTADAVQLMLSVWPYALLNLAVIVICVAATTQLLKKKLTL